MIVFVASIGISAFFLALSIYRHWQARRDIVQRSEFYRYAPPDVLPIGWMITFAGLVTVGVVLALVFTH